jgi:Xaa-Pro dipeptidase
VEEPGCYGAIEVTKGTAILFLPRLSPDYAIWEGKVHTLPDFKQRYDVDDTYYTDEIARVLNEKNASLLLTLVSLAWEQTLAAFLPVLSSSTGKCSTC